MSLRAARLCGIALLFAVGLLAVLLAAGVFAPSGVGAHVPDTDDDDMCDDSHVDFQDSPADCDDDGHQPIHRNVSEVDGGRDRKLALKVYPPLTGSYLGAGNKIEITLPDFDLSVSNFSTTGMNALLFGRIKLDDSGDGDAIPPTYAVAEGQKLKLTLPDLNSLVDDDEYLTITIEEGTGILTPETPSTTTTRLRWWLHPAFTAGGAASLVGAARPLVA